jgi:hypothetical protein
MQFKQVSTHVEMTHVVKFKEKKILNFGQNRALYGRHVIRDLWMHVCVAT